MREAIILAGGLGTRLQSVVNDRPKCMALVADKPFLKYLLDYLRLYKVDHVVLSLGYKSEIILDWLKGQDYSFQVSYVIEDQPLGTGGGIRLATTKLATNTCFILNGDTFFDVDLNVMEKFHSEKSADITLALKSMKDFDRYGSVKMNADGKILKFLEKKYCNEGLINGGVYFINKFIFNKCSLPYKFSFEKEILEAQVHYLDIVGFPSDRYFIDIGIPSDYAKANVDFLNYK